METISIGFSYHKNNLLSKVIQLVDNCPYSHVYIRRNSKYGEYVYQASGLQVNFTNIDIFLEKNVIVEEYEFDLADDKKEKLLAFFIKYAGAEYALTSLFKLLAIILAAKIGKKLEFKGDGNKTFICSELGAFFCEEILEIDIPGDDDFITPKGLNPIVRQYAKKRII